MIIIVITTVLQKVGLDEICRNGIRDTAHSSHTQPNSQTIQQKNTTTFPLWQPFLHSNGPKIFFEADVFYDYSPLFVIFSQGGKSRPSPCSNRPLCWFLTVFFIAKSFWAWSQSLLVNILILIIILAWLWHLTVLFPKEKKTNILEWYISNTNHKKLGIKAKINQKDKF